MTKKIIISLGVIGVVAAAVIGGTIAYFNDVETSSGNILVAGSIDLKVDHVKQTYNDVDCETCSVDIWSSSATKVIGGTGAYAGGYPTNAEELTYIHPNWLQEIPGSDAKWIWVTNPVLAADTTNGAEYTFQKKFNWNGSIAGITLELALAADNGYKIVFNGVTVADQLGTESNYGALVDTSVAETAMLSEVQNGENTLEITVRNKPGNSNPASNPAGLIFDLTIEREGQDCEEDSAFQKACRLWNEKDLEQGDTFFNFDDVKPGDHGTNVISVHVDDNDSYVCLIVNDDDDQENEIVDPETEAGDITDPEGELSNYLDIFVWEDLDSDGLYDPLTESSLYEGSIQTELVQMTLAGGGPTEFIGLAWCAGDIVVDHDTGDISCDGNGMLDDAQTDSFEANLTLYAEQIRNNPDFSCLDAEKMLEEE